MYNLEILGLKRVGDTNGIIGICNSKKDRQHNGQTKKAKKGTNNDLQNSTQKTKD